MITVLLTRGGGQDGIYLKLPAPQSEIDAAFSELDAIDPDASKTRITEVISNVYNLNGYLKSTDISQLGVLDKLTDLARKLQTMDRNGCLKFEGVLDANSVNGLDDILRLSEKLEEYAVLPDAVSGSSLGKYLVNQDAIHFSEAVKPYLDYQIIGEEFYSNHGGAFCRCGYVVRKDELPEALRQTAEDQNREWIISLRLKNRDHIAVNLAMPATDDALDQALQSLQADEFSETEISVVDYSLPYLAQLIPQDCIRVEDANELALTIEEMKQHDGSLMKYLAVLTAEQPETFQDACRLAIDLDDYEIVPSSTDEYGRAVLRRCGANDELLDAIDGYMDFAGLSADAMKDDGVVNTGFGLLRRLSEPFRQITAVSMRME